MTQMSIEYHEDKAKQSLSSAEGLFWQDYPQPAYAALCIADAQVHATIALVGAVQELNETLRERLP